jgi:hypothetical protein
MRAELGSYPFVHPITRRLTQREFIAAEQGLLTSFGSHHADPDAADADRRDHLRDRRLG